MPDRFIESHIRQLPIFAKLPQQQLNWVMDAIRVLRFERGEMVFAQGEPTRGLYMFVEGRAQLVQTTESAQERTIGIIGENQYLNEVALYKPGVESASLRVLERSTVLFISREQLMNIVSHHPEIKQNLPIPVAARRQQQREKVFRGQRDNEIVLMDSRRHPWAFIRRAWLPALLIIVVAILTGFIPSSGVSLALSGIVFVIAGALMLYFYVEWHNDHVIITQQRIIHIERQIPTFRTLVSEVPLVAIQAVDADIITSDPFSRVFNYGTVELKTAGHAGNIELTVMPRPEYIQDLIFKHRERYDEEFQQEHRSRIRAEVDKVLGRESGEAGPAPKPHAPPDTPVPATEQAWSPWRTQWVDSNGNTIYRKHFTLWLRAAIWPLMWLVGTFVLFILTLATPVLSGFGAIGPLFAFFLLLIGALWFYWVDWDWRNDLYIVRDETIELVHRRPLWLQNEADQILLNSVDNVTSEQSGLLPTMLDYGNVRIALLGADLGNAKIFRGVPAPRDVQAEITRRQTRLRYKGREEEERRHREEIAEYLSVYHETLQDQNQTPQDEDTSGQQTQRTVRDRMRPPNIPRQRRDN